ncbi:MAG: YihA family ribosome biogenesis GTP-binding protein [Alphaproteobacteria bacterium]|nr:YihA family ribosome biogenesis GTP-binding protein [Alphaproteobacteria bacterium]
MNEPAGGTAAPADDAAVEAARLLFAGPCTFTAAAATEATLPPLGLPEVAFAGRSNVGKSSLVNALTGRTALARTSRTPGRTQELIFFDLGGRLGLVDLPGYGYAKVAKGKVAAWMQLVEAYLAGRPTLRRVCLLVDARHGLKDSDRATMRLLDTSAVAYQIVLTKTDAIGPATLAARLGETAAAAAGHTAAHPEIIASSARQQQGIAALRLALALLALPAGHTRERIPQRTELH